LQPLWKCSKCDKIFEGENAENECLKHEEECNPEITYQCHKCGRVDKWNMFDHNAYIKENQWNSFDLEKKGYGSKLDGCSIHFDLCDECLISILETFRLKEDAIKGEYYYD